MRTLVFRDFAPSFKYYFLKKYNILGSISANMISSVTEGKATIHVSDDTSSDVFYNPVQQFNRDISIAVINQFSEDRSEDPKYKFEDGLKIMEGLSATGLRSIRYSKEIPKSKLIIANDFSKRAVETIQNNIEKNEVGHIVKSSHGDASAVMLNYKKFEDRFSVVDLDPYGSPTQFLDSAVQCVADGGLLCVTCTDMAVLCGNASETCYSKYGAVSLRGKNCHEMALRIVLQCIEAHANRYGRYIEPLISLSIDFYVRVFVRVFTSQKKCKETTSKLGHVYRCTGCESMHIQRLGEISKDDKGNTKYFTSRGPPVDRLCKYCRHPHTFGGPFWLDPIHDMDFVNRLQKNLEDNIDFTEKNSDYGTLDRMKGMIALVSEELPDVPFYFVQDRLCSLMKLPVGKSTVFRSALLNAGYRVSMSHANRGSMKTDAPNDFIWDMIKAYEKEVNKQMNRDETKRNLNDINKPIYEFIGNYCEKTLEKPVDFTHHPDAEPESKSKNLLRFQENPLPNWGPKQKAKVMMNKNSSNGGTNEVEIMDKRARNQGKYSNNQKKKRQNICDEGDVIGDNLHLAKKEKNDS